MQFSLVFVQIQHTKKKKKQKKDLYPNIFFSTIIILSRKHHMKLKWPQRMYHQQTNQKTFFIFIFF